PTPTPTPKGADPFQSWVDLKKPGHTSSRRTRPAKEEGTTPSRRVAKPPRPPKQGLGPWPIALGAAAGGIALVLGGLSWRRAHRALPEPPPPPGIPAHAPVATDAQGTAPPGETPQLPVVPEARHGDNVDDAMALKPLSLRRVNLERLKTLTLS